jgi:hypothetical protein
MNERKQSVNVQTPVTNTNSDISGIVVDVIKDTDSDFVQEFPNVEIETKDTTIIGYAIVKRLDDFGGGESKTLNAYPPYDLIQGLPLRGESVFLVSVGGVLHYKRTFSTDVSRGRATKNRIQSLQPELRDSNSASEYNEVSATKTSKQGNPKTEESKFGDYFELQQINPLKLYEGDSLIQSRFGQTIRLSGYNNENNTFSPTIVIRNRQNGEVEVNEKRGTLIEEDINKDGSSIVLSSRDYKIDLKPGTIDDGGSQQLDTPPKKFDTFPNELKGTDQILINSGRVILSSKKDEMIFISKGDYGFISDGKLSIDNGKAGAELDFNGDVKITTNDNDTYILGNSGLIFLNTKSEDEPLVRGETLRELLELLIDEIKKMVFATPAGPTQPGPLPPNVEQLDIIKGRLSEFLSTQNFTDKKDEPAEDGE